MKRSLNLCNIYTLLWCIYYLQGALYENGGVISRLVLLLVLLISVVFVSIETYKKATAYDFPRYIKGVFAILGLGIVYGSLRIIIGETILIYGNVQDRTSYLKVFLIAFLPILSYYYFSLSGYISEQWIRKWYYVFLICVLISFFGEQIRSFGAASIQGYSEESTRTSVGYKFMTLMPALAFLKKTTRRYLHLFIIVMMTLFAMKRGAIISVLLGSMFFLWKGATDNEGGKKRGVRLLVAFITATAIFILFKILMTSNVYFNMRINEMLQGDSSGRDQIYPMFMDAFLNKSSIMQQLFGRGANGTLKLFNVYAHNDWLELLIDTGLVGLLFYLYYWVGLYKAWRWAKRVYFPAYLAIGLFFITELSRSMYSMSYEGFLIYSTSILAYSIAIVYNPQIIKHDEG